jgi:flagellar biosynthetic protein FliR
MVAFVVLIATLSATMLILKVQMQDAFNYLEMLF